jgi:hypothetical protein
MRCIPYGGPPNIGLFAPGTTSFYTGELAHISFRYCARWGAKRIWLARPTGKQELVRMLGKDHAILDRIQVMRKEELSKAEGRRSCRFMEARPW